MKKCKFCGDSILSISANPDYSDQCGRCQYLWEHIRRMPIKVLNRIVVDARRQPNYIKPGDRR